MRCREDVQAACTTAAEGTPQNCGGQPDYRTANMRLHCPVVAHRVASHTSTRAWEKTQGLLPGSCGSAQATGTAENCWHEPAEGLRPPQGERPHAGPQNTTDPMNGQVSPGLLSQSQPHDATHFLSSFFSVFSSSNLDS